MTVTISGSTGIDTVQDGVVTDTKLNLTANSAEIKEALNASNGAPIYACRAWVNFNGTGTVAIRASGNVSSITDNGTGDYTVNFTNAMPDTNYSVVGTGQNNTQAIETVVLKGGTPLATGSAQIRTVYSSGHVDSPFVCVAVFR